MNFKEIAKLDAYFKKLFGARVRVVLPPKVDEPAEVYLGEEFIGIVFVDVDDDDDERSYNFQMSIIERDLE